MTFRSLTLVALAIATSTVSTSLKADETARPTFRVVFFTPSDVEPPVGVPGRLKECVDYSRMFYGKWMKHWGYESEEPLHVNRDADGFPEILYVKGQHTLASGRYRQLGFQAEVIQTACRKYELDPTGQVWWIFTYKGPESRGFRGGGNSIRGGTSTAIYDPALNGHLRLTDELGSDEQMQTNSKAAIHELGHAFGLPHIGPNESDESGNSLMGPVIRAYRTRYPDEARVYLTKASAAMLWKHPLFSGSVKDRDRVPNARIADFQAAYEKQGDRLIVTGKLESDYPAHSVVVANGQDTTPSPYWLKCFVGKVAEDGTFQVYINELDPTDGLLKIVFCFNNGAVVGENSGLGLNSGFLKTYRFDGQGFELDPTLKPKALRLFSRQRARR